jgi:hypothetical protein
MKIRILLILLLICPFFIKAQVTQSGVDKTTEETFKTVFYNKGKMFVGVNNPTGTNEVSSVYVYGSVKLVDGSEVDQQGTTTITGDFINGQSSTTAPNNLFTYSGTVGTIRFENPKSGVQFQFPIGSTNSGTDISKGTLKNYTFDLTYKQEIKFEGTADKKTNFINFPNVELGEKAYVALTATAAATVQNLTTKTGSVFSIEGRPTTNAALAGKGIDYGHLIIKGNVARESATTITDVRKDQSYNMLDLQLYDYNTPATNTATTTGTGNIDNYAPVNLSGITSPFGRLANDYFFFHTQFWPSKMWEKEVANVDPRDYINPGEGYVVAMNLSDFDWNVINKNWGVEKENRASGGFQFSTLFLDQKKGFIANGRDWGNPAPSVISDANYNSHLANETFLTANSTVRVKLKKNSKEKVFLANPFMAPLDLGAMIIPDGQSQKIFNVQVGSNYLTNEVKNKFWIIHQSALAYHTPSQRNYYKINYYSNSAAGSTGYLEKPSPTQYFVAPIQVFVLQLGGLVNDNTEFVFDASKLTHSNAVSSKTEREIVDELLIQVVNEENGAEDRHAIVFSNNASAESEDINDDVKDDLNYVFTIDEKTTIRDQREGAVYTKSSNNKAMRTNAVPTNTKSLPLYISPTETPQNMVLRPYRLESLRSVEGVWLEDKLEKTITQLTPNSEYPFVSTVSTDPAAQENRYVLHFSKVASDDLLEETLSPITCYYSNSILYIKGLNKDDINSNVEIFDIQGRLIGKTKIDVFPQKEYSIPVITGTYIVKITGKRNYTTKFLSTQN